MKIYLAASWKLENTVLMILDILKADGHEVDAFCDPSGGRASFNWSELTVIMAKERLDLKTLNAKDMMKHWRVKEAFEEDKKYIEWADALIMLLPSGKSSHLEAGYAAGKGKKVYILGGFEAGEFETMYGFADELIYYEDFKHLQELLKENNPSAMNEQAALRYPD